MPKFNDWCGSADTQVNDHSLSVLTAVPKHLTTGISATAAIVPSHYAAEEKIARALARLGKEKAAQLIQLKLPTTKAIRSGDLGEILATEWIDAHTDYMVPIKRLRWKDHRNMAMRGDDVIGLLLDQDTQRLRFLKTEAKSRARLTAQVLIEARTGLDKDYGSPSSHALMFIADQLEDRGELALTDAIHDALLKHGIPITSVRHLLFTFSGNSPEGLLTASLKGYPGPITQLGVGLHIDGHPEFISAVYEQVIENANNA